MDLTQLQRRAGWAALALALFAAPSTPASPAEIRLVDDVDSPYFATVEARIAEGEMRRELAAYLASHADGSAVLALYTGRELAPDSAKPAVAGRWTLEGETLRFRPRWSLEPGLDYVARLDLSAVGGSGDPIVTTFALPAAKLEPSTVVTAVYPTASELPENLLRFYVHFSAPMSRGEAYDRLRLVDSDGEPLPYSFLEIDAELWDPGMRRLTLFFDPGRIKRGLQPHLEAGPPLREGSSYRLVIDEEWLDADGQPLVGGYEKAFTVGAPDREAPNTADWQIETPVVGSREPLAITFPEPLDHGLLGRVVRVIDASGNRLAGSTEVGPEERSWRFLPDAAWQAGSYALSIETLLEDLAGNNLEKVFDVDLTAAPTPAVETENLVSLPFEVR